MNFHGRIVFVNDSNVEKALRKFKKKIANSNILQDLRDKEAYVKPTTRRKTAEAQAKRRWQKHVLSQQLNPSSY